MNNKPLSAYKKKKLIESFCDELTASQAAHRLNLDRNTVNKYFRRIRECIAAYREYRKMQLVISIMKSPGHKPEIISKQLSSTLPVDRDVTVHIMHIAGQLLTEVDTRSHQDVPSFIFTMGESTKAAAISMEVNLSHPLRDGDLSQLADEFCSFAVQRFKKYFGIKSDYAYLYVKEAEFVFNERDRKMREKVLGGMMERIFK
jgi:transposase